MGIFFLIVWFAFRNAILKWVRDTVFCDLGIRKDWKSEDMLILFLQDFHRTANKLYYACPTFFYKRNEHL